MLYGSFRPIADIRLPRIMDWDFGAAAGSPPLPSQSTRSNGQGLGGSECTGVAGKSAKPFVCCLPHALVRLDREHLIAMIQETCGE